MGSKAGQAPLPTGVAFGDSCSGSKLLLAGGSERCGLLQDSLGAGLGPPDGSTGPCWQQDVCLILQLTFLFQGQSLQSSKPELISALAGVFEKAFGAFLSPCAQPLLWSTLWAPGDQNIWPACLCICIMGPILLIPEFP